MTEADNEMAEIADPGGIFRAKRRHLEAAELALAVALAERRAATEDMQLELPTRRRRFEQAHDLVVLLQAVVDDETRRLDEATLRGAHR